MRHAFPTLLKTAAHVVAILVLWGAANITLADDNSVARHDNDTYRAEVKIGVLAPRGEAAALSRWQATADYLNQQIANVNFSITPLSLSELRKSVQNKELDFVLTNTGNYVQLESEFGISRIATISTQVNNRGVDKFGAVIFTHSSRTDINTLVDLKNKRFIAVEKSGFGGFQMAWRELRDAGIDPFQDFSALSFTHFPQEEVVFNVLNGKADGGTLRTGELELLASENKINLVDIKILNPKTDPTLPLLLSTRTYPEWPISKLTDTSELIAQKVAIALLEMQPNAAAARLGRYHGWTVPQNYQSVHEMFRELRIPPYADLGEITFSDITNQYGHWLIFGIILILTTVGWIMRVEHLVKKRTNELESEITDRKRAEEESRQRQIEMAHLSRVNSLGEMATSLAHEINQPLSAISNYTQGSIRRIKNKTGGQDEILDALNNVVKQAERASDIIRRIRAFIRKEPPHKSTFNLNDIVKDTASFLAHDMNHKKISLVLNLDLSLPMTQGDKVQIEQVLLNLAGNAIDAMDTPNTTTADNDKILTIKTFTQDGETVVHVHDTGSGIKDAELQKVFEPFYSTKRKGMGMGLSISKTLIEAQGGRLWAEQHPARGTSFFFTLPPTPEDARA